MKRSPVTGGLNLLPTILCMSILASTARAQTAADDPVTEDEVPSGREANDAVEPAPGGDEFSKFLHFDALAEQNLAVSLPPSIDSIWRDKGGWRSALAKHDISLTATTYIGLTHDVLGNNPRTEPQTYNGQKFTAAGNQDLIMVMGLERYGLPNSQLLLAGQVYHSSWEQTGPNIARMKLLAYNQTFADDAVQLKVGWLSNWREFIGVFAGGSPLLASGTSGLIPIQVGMSADPSTTPSINLAISSRNGNYFKGGIQRSMSPLGLIDEVKHNGIGLDFGAERASALYIAEFGRKKAASSESRQMWFRAGGLYNTSDYTRFSDGGYKDNWAAFALGDYQAVQTDRAAPYRGIFVGATAEHADPEVNVYSRYYELRTYAVGLFDARPTDTALLTVSHTRFSNDARSSFGQQGIATPSAQFQATASYSLHLSPGVYLTSSLSYLDHPAFGPASEEGLLVGLSLFLRQ